VNTPGENQFGLRFEADEHDQALRLANVIQQIQETPARRRPQRLRILREALVDNNTAILTNLAEGGCFLRTKGSYRRGDVVEVGFELDQQALRLPAQVRWCTPIGIGVQYLSPDPAQIRLISDFIARRKRNPL
jgi:Tfp pilus assembly protein PilZ